MAILIIDSYDSFTNNLVDLVKQCVGNRCSVHVVRNDGVDLSAIAHNRQWSSCFECVIIGPGPGDPNNKSSLGIAYDILNSPEFSNVPILGVCLGFQAIALNAGGRVTQLRQIKHGQVSTVKVMNENDEVFKGMPSKFDCVRYHSLHVSSSGTIIPLAYAEEGEESPVLMAGKHPKKPFYGVQYHPESICSTSGAQLISNFYKFAVQWNKLHRSVEYSSILEPFYVNNSFRIDDRLVQSSQKLLRSPSRAWFYHKNLNCSLSAVQIAEFFKPKSFDPMVLTSAGRGKYSIVGLCVAGDTTEITWSISSADSVTIGPWKRPQSTHKISSIYQFLQTFMSDRFQLNNNNIAALDLPFVGGLVGYMTYESGQFIDRKVAAKRKTDDSPDIKMVFIERCVVVDETTNSVFVISLKEQDELWVENAGEELSRISKKSCVNDKNTNNNILASATITKPKKQQYCDSFDACQHHLTKGDSYELCLCCKIGIKFETKPDPWALFKSLLKSNPAPFAGFLEFGDSVLVSSSPERFVSWKNTKKSGTFSVDFDKTCQLRPIKGTVKKTSSTTYDDAENILKTPKEMGENLMIVDLIRHDLYSHCDSFATSEFAEAAVANVRVSKLMQIEEYETVYQLVSVIECDISYEHEQSQPAISKGFQILTTSLPPGSMTGAPKKRSVELLQHIETENRGIYSGVFGYWSVDDQADWSVVIRSFFTNDKHGKQWFAGAGGAITVLSTVEGEWEEMNVKLESVLGSF